MPFPFRLKPCLLAFAISGLLTSSVLHAKAPAAASTSTPAAAEKKPAPPPLASPQLRAQMLLSEIALARGLLDDASFGYSDLARRSNDPRLQQRAREIEFARVMFHAQFRPADAEKILRQLLIQNPEGRERLLLQLPGIFSRNPDKQLVLQTIQRLVQPYPDLAEARYTEGIALRDAQDTAGAYLAARQAHSIKPDWEPAILLLAEVASSSQRKEAGDILSRYSQLNPQALDARIGLIRILLQDKQLETARTAYRQLLKEYPDKPELAFSLIPVAIEAADLPGAESILENLLAQNWGDTDRLHLVLGQLQAELGKKEAALQNLEAVEPGPFFLEAQNNKARLLAAGKQIDLARQSLRAAAQREPRERSNLLVSEAALLRQSDDKTTAFSLLNEALSHDPDHLEALYDSALLAEQLDKPEILEQRLRRVIELKPSHAHALNALGYSFADRNIRLDEAEQLLEKAIRLSPDDPAIIDSLGWLRFRQNRLAEAEEILNKAFSLFPDPEVAGHLVETLFSAGKKEAAKQLWKQMLSKHPDNTLLLKTGTRLGL